MEALRESHTSRTYTVHVPKKDAAIFRSMTSRMGWTAKIQKPKKTRLQLSIEAAHRGPLRSFDSVEEMMKDLLSDD